jgi:hypothetical protein
MTDSEKAMASTSNEIFLINLLRSNKMVPMRWSNWVSKLLIMPCRVEGLTDGHASERVEVAVCRTSINSLISPSQQRRPKMLDASADCRANWGIMGLTTGSFGQPNPTQRRYDEMPSCVGQDNCNQVDARIISYVSEVGVCKDLLALMKDWKWGFRHPSWGSWENAWDSRSLLLVIGVSLGLSKSSSERNVGEIQKRNI